MKAGVASPEGVVIADIPSPKPKPTDILVKIKAIALNRADLGSARGDTSHGAAAGKPVGSEFSGEVIEAGSEVRDFNVGDRVMCHSPGSHAQYAASDHGRAMKVPDGMSFEQAATLPIGLNTLHNALVTAGRMKAGEAVMVQGASSGVGIIGLQIAKLMGAKFVVGTSTNDARRARLKEFGADLVIDPRKANWSEDVLKATDGKGAEVVIDMISGPTVNENMKAAAVLGRIVNVGRLGGGHIEFDCNLHANKRIAYIGVTHRTRSIDELRAEVSNMRADLWDAVSAGKLSLPIDRVFKLDDAEAAQAHMRTNAHFGKIVMVP